MTQCEQREKSDEHVHPTIHEFS